MIELLVVVLIIGILAAIAVPQYFKVTEKGKAAEALTTFGDIHGAQERYLANAGNYCTTVVTSCPGFDLSQPNMKYFNTMPPFTAGSTPPSYMITLTRNGTPAVYGAYSVTYDVEPGVAPIITCSQAQCAIDLMPQ